MPSGREADSVFAVVVVFNTKGCFGQTKFALPKIPNTLDTQQPPSLPSPPPSNTQTYTSSLSLPDNVSHSLVLIMLTAKGSLSCLCTTYC